jgi:hypothetical protein
MISASGHLRSKRSTSASSRMMGGETSKVYSRLTALRQSSNGTPRALLNAEKYTLGIEDDLKQTARSYGAHGLGGLRSLGQF